jgi:hypothetical protein
MLSALWQPVGSAYSTSPRAVELNASGSARCSRIAGVTAIGFHVLAVTALALISLTSAIVGRRLCCQAAPKRDGHEGAVGGAAILSFSSVQVLRTSAVISEHSSI